jgi:phospholipase/lecithinase/hemolysin
MRHTNIALALLTAAVLTACGGNGSKSGDQSLKTKYSAQVTFGDSLSDVGTYAVGGVLALGGGKYTINGDNTAKDPTLTGKNWTDLVAAQLGLPAPCAAQTGLTGDATKGFSVAVQNHANCTNYAQGGARVSNPVGPGNALTGSPLGQMTVPVAQQIANHLAANNGKFSGNELVTVMAGGNDILSLLGQLQIAATAAGTAAGNAAGQTTFATSLTMQLAAGATNPQTAAQAIGLAIQTESARPGHTNDTVVGAAVTAAAQQPGNSAVGSPAVYGPMVVKAQSDAATAGATAGAKAGADYFAANAAGIVSGMAAAGADLANLVKTQVIAKGANYVVVNNLPDVANTPSGNAQSADVKGLIAQAVDAFNAQLKTGLAGQSQVLYVDLWTVSHDEVTNPTPYGLTNTKDKACANNALGGTSLVCNATNLSGSNVSHYMFADDIHPTPYEYSLVARYVLEQMTVRGWL